MNPEALGELDEPAQDDPKAAAVAAFVAMLDVGADLRMSGGELFAAYVEQRHRQGWPDMTATTFGRHLRVAVERVGGSKIKSGSQVYCGVGLPREWRQHVAAVSCGEGSQMAAGD